MSATWPWVLAFARRMEAKLEQNRHKGDREGWQKDSANALLRRLSDELDELKAAVARPLINSERQIAIADEAANVANFAMMIADVAGDLQPRPEPAPDLLAALEKAHTEFIEGCFCTCARDADHNDGQPCSHCVARERINFEIEAAIAKARGAP